MAKTVLVAGGAGYIGSHVSVELLQAGYDVVVADDFSNSDKTCFEGVKKITGRKDIPFYEVDLKDYKSTEKIFSERKIDAVIHFAGFKAVGESVQEPIMYYENNLLTFINIIKASVAHGGSNILFSSSATVYGEPESQPVTEMFPRQEATSPYGNAKQICEDILRDSVKAYKVYGEEVKAGSKRNGPVKGIALRYFNPIGAHPSALIGELPSGVPNNLMPYITQTAIGKREKLTVFGDDYPTPDGTCLRDYIDIVDLAKAHVFAVTRMVEGKMKEDYEVFNIGTGKPLSVLELVKTFESVNGLKLNYVIGKRREGDVVAVWADPSLAEKELGWKAERKIEDTVAAAWAWEKHIAK